MTLLQKLPMARQYSIQIFAILLLTTKALSTTADLKTLFLSPLKLLDNLNKDKADLAKVEMKSDDIQKDSVKTGEEFNFHQDGAKEAERFVDRIILTDASDLQNEMINQKQFTFVLNPESLCDGDVSVLALIKSTPQKFLERQDIRKTWGSVKQYKGYKIKPVFIMGKLAPSNFSVFQNELVQEFVKYGDIIQGDFIEHYKNQTYKTIMGLTWVKQFCNQAKFILNTNDDTMVDPYHLVDFLQTMVQENKSENLLYCSTFFDQGPVRNPSDKNYITLNEYPYDKFPPHCEGFGYILSKDALDSLLQAAETVPFLWLDDVYTTGFLALKADIKHHDMMDEHSYKFMQKSQIDSGLRDTMFLVAKYRRLRKNWNTAWTAIHTIQQMV